jgi:predicted nucleic acid-binding protein
LNALRLTVVTLSADRHLPTLQLLAGQGVKGGATYDGLVAATAAQHGCTLVSLDRRALSNYEAVNADARLLRH